MWIKDKEADRAGSETKRLLGVVFQDKVFLINLLRLKRILKAGRRCMELLEIHSKKDWQNWWRYLISGDYINRPVGKLSGGQRRRIDIARALIYRPEIRFLMSRRRDLTRRQGFLYGKILRDSSYRGEHDGIPYNSLHGGGGKCRICCDS